jgi:ubiquinone/menaquinone biosynthesis C-methylase UbiE
VNERVQLSHKTRQATAFLQTEKIHAEWESEFLHGDLDLLYDAAFERIVRALDARPGSTILDAGCGYCHHATRLARLGLNVHGVDISNVALEQGRRRLEAQGLADRVRLQNADLLALPFMDGAFRYASCWGVLMHVPELDRALGELARVLEPGGRLAIMENNANSLDALVWDRFVRGAKRMLGRPVHPVQRTARGSEEWRETGLLVRRTRIPYLVDALRERGLDLIERFPSQFTEIYASLPAGRARHVLARFNHLWFQNAPGTTLALGNVFIFEKRMEVS